MGAKPLFPIAIMFIIAPPPPKANSGQYAFTGLPSYDTYYNKIFSYSCA